MSTPFVYNMMHQNDLTLLDYETVVSTHFIGRYRSRSRAQPEQKAGSKSKQQYHFQPNNLPLHLPEYQHSRKPCEYWYKKGFAWKTFVKCTECGVFLCLVKERNCFLDHHSQLIAKDTSLLWLSLHTVLQKFW